MIRLFRVRPRVKSCRASILQVEGAGQYSTAAVTGQCFAGAGQSWCMLGFAGYFRVVCVCKLCRVVKGNACRAVLVLLDSACRALGGQCRCCLTVHAGHWAVQMLLQGSTCRGVLVVQGSACRILGSAGGVAGQCCRNLPLSFNLRIPPSLVIDLNHFFKHILTVVQRQFLQKALYLCGGSYVQFIHPQIGLLLPP